MMCQRATQLAEAVIIKGTHCLRVPYKNDVASVSSNSNLQRFYLDGSSLRTFRDDCSLEGANPNFIRSFSTLCRILS